MKHIAKFYTENQIFYVDQKDNQLVCYCYETSGRKELSLGVVAGLMQSFFNSSKEKFLKKEGFYDVYVNEETGYHHFYQNGKQDISKFFQMNGEDALLYKDLPVDDRIKQFHYQNSRAPYTRYISMMIDLLSVTAFFLEMQYVVPRVYSQLDPRAYYFDATTLSQSINSSAELTDREKEILCNDKLFSDICTVPMRSFAFHDLREKTSNVSIVGLDESDVIHNDIREKLGLSQFAGYYSSLEPNVLHVDDMYYNRDVVTHEFVHLLQSCDEKYLTEACAEIIAYEYYDAPVDSYLEEVKRTRVLMEIVGSDPVWQSNFSGDSSKLHELLKHNLSSEDYESVCRILKTSPGNTTDEKMNQVNQRFDEILSRLYENIYHEPIENNQAIQLIYQSISTDPNFHMDVVRHYFNRTEDYEDIPDFSISYVLPIDEAVDKGLVDVNVTYKGTVPISYEEYVHGKEKGEVVWDEYQAKNIDGYEISQHFYTEDDKALIDWQVLDKTTQTISFYDDEEARQLGFIEKKYYKMDTIAVDYREFDYSMSERWYSYQLVPKSDKYQSYSLEELQDDSSDVAGMVVKCSKNFYLSDPTVLLSDDAKSK